MYLGEKEGVTEGARVVKDLTKDFKDKWHRVYFDNFFTSKALICDLDKGGIYGCGTAWLWYSQEGQERISRHSEASEVEAEVCNM